MSEGIRASSPDYDFAVDETVDTVELDPELANIARKVEKEVERRSVTPGPALRSPSPEIGGGPENVMLRVKLIPHPLNPNGEEKLIGFKMRRVRLLPCYR